MNFPLEARFKVVALAPQVSVTDAAGKLLLYVKQKAFSLKESVTVFGDSAQTQPLFRINADRVLDISARYSIVEVSGGPVGEIQRQGMRSLWRAHYDIQRGGVPMFAVQEENPWVKFFDGIIGEVPVLGLLTGYVLHPAYRLSRAGSETPLLRVVKQPAFWEGVYKIEQKEELPKPDQTLAVLSILMLLLLERQRG